MGEEDTTKPPVAPSQLRRRIRQRRNLIARLENAVATYWQALLSGSAPYADAALERAIDRYAKHSPPRLGR